VIEAVKEDVLRIMYNLDLEGKSVKCYIFGSALRSSFYNDIDLLVVYENVEILRLIKRKMLALELLYPIHLMCLTFLEEREFDFVYEQKALL